VAGIGRNDHYFNLIQSLSKHYAFFDIETPWTELPEHVRHVLLHGSGTEAIEFSYREEAGRSSRKRHAFEGILPTDGRYRETESAMVRESWRAIWGCARAGVPGHAPESRGALRVSSPGAVFRNLRSDGRTGARVPGSAESRRLAREVAAKIVKGMVQRLRFLSDVGLDY